mmetsp:Transcript_1981/g.5881  ORF Transcript_1981/g.5881 Transcript_1981/m.5881 type:complete len:316 (+) Transcript_1981:109-1056(+)
MNWFLSGSADDESNQHSEKLEPHQKKRYYGSTDTKQKKTRMLSERLERIKSVDGLVEEVYGSRRVLLMYTGSTTLLLFAGVALYTKVVEAWPWLTAFYFTGYVVTGVGYGDVNFKTSNWRYLVLANIELFGSLIVGTLLSASLAALVLTEDEEDVRSTKATKRRFLKCAVISSTILIVSAIVVGVAENWSWAETLYWAVDTVVTVGNGYKTPQHSVGKGVAILTFILAAPTFLLLLTAMIFYPRCRLREIHRDRAFDEATLHQNHSSGDDLEGAAFALKLLLDARLVHPDDLDLVLAKYSDLKANDNGPGGGALA